ncbi:ABC transporter permease [Streptomyces sp. NPDC059452]|uniref:ABC transporter permease n=1 Tax=Streptomyces sp. NPDC059452 TaxID=3346835 RepID=UPI0036AAD238
MSTVNGFVRLTRMQALLDLRDGAQLLLPLGLPLLILTMNAMGDSATRPSRDHSGRTFLDVTLMPMTLLMIISMLALIFLPTNMAQSRRIGVLRRLSVTPVRPIALLVAQTVTNLLTSVLGIAVALLVGALAFDAGMPQDALSALLVFALVAFAMYGLGLLLAALAPSPNVVVAAGFVLFFGMMAVGGGLGDPDSLPAILRAVGEYLPYGAGLNALGAAWAGAAPEPVHLAGLLVAGVAGSAVAAANFRWE